MNRTNEFFKLVSLSEVPQQDINYVDLFINSYKTHINILELFKKAEKMTKYDKFKLQPVLEELLKSIEFYKDMQLNVDGNQDTKEAFATINEIIKMRTIKFTIRYKKLANSLKSTQSSQSPVQQQNQEKYTNKNNNQQFLIQEEQQKNVNIEKYEQRKRIVNRISEMGDIVENISLHVSLQEMELKRIDDILIKTDSFSKRALNDLKDTWNMVSEKRKTLIKFFVFWLCLILTFYFIRRK